MLGIIKDKILETERIVLRKMVIDDYKELCKSLQDEQVMYAWEYSFSDDEVIDWIERRIVAYEKFGYDYFLAIDKKDNRVIGQIGLLNEYINQQNFIGIGYIINREDWGKGYALEGSQALLNYAFNTLKTNQVVADIRPENAASIKIAEKLGMKIIQKFDKNVKGKEMLHLLYSINK